jgi:PiT family inorganic phosphate transporter
LFFLSSGFFLGWSLGANDTANIFGTAVATRMVRFSVAAAISVIFVILGSVISGAGAAHTLGSLGAVNALAGSFTVALAAAVVVTAMTKLDLPVSTSQAIVGAIIGWNLFTGSPTDPKILGTIASSWLFSILLAACLACLLYFLAKAILNHAKIHLLRLDRCNRLLLISVGAFGAYSLGANNIANVMGVFVPVGLFADSLYFGVIPVSGVQKLFFLGALSIGVGVVTYAHRVINTVGNEILKMTPVMALIVVLAHSLVLLLFSSQSLETWLIDLGLPSFPLVPVSSSQVVVGAVIGIGIAKTAGRGINFRILGRIALGWLVTPALAIVLCLVSLFVVQNVFEQEVVYQERFVVNPSVIEALQQQDIYTEPLELLNDQKFQGAESFREALKIYNWEARDIFLIFHYARIEPLHIKADIRHSFFNPQYFHPGEMDAVKKLDGKTFDHPWQLHQELARISPLWQLREETPENRRFNNELRTKRELLEKIFRHTTAGGAP